VSKVKKLFGTDGIRGEANRYPMTGEVAMALGRAVTHYFWEKSGGTRPPLIVIGKDTRRSCYMIEQAFSAGVCSQGGKVILTGPLPTPGVAFVTQSMRADAGVMISASHNKYSDNGIKIFDAKGFKLPDAVELLLEDMILHPEKIPTLIGAELGRAQRLDESIGRYIVFVKNAFDNRYSMEGMRVVVDCANGAAYKVAPLVFEELGAEVFPIGVKPDGTNINDYCGSLYPEECREELLKYRADIGICLDGDADRLVIIDSKGEIIPGDVLIGLFAKLLFDRGELVRGDTVVGTVMTNLGLERYLENLGLKLERTKVGDRYIIESMKGHGHILGGEPSGHVIFTKHASTGDGILGALKAIECMKYYKKPLSDLAREITLYPQLLKNITVNKQVPLADVPAIVIAMKRAEDRLGNKGRILLRYSGTEPLLRIMVEGESASLIEEVCNDLESVVKENL